MSHQRQSTKLIHILLLVALCTIPYLAHLHSSWHLDDFPNIVNNSLLHIKTLDLQTLKQTLFADPVNPGAMFRPVANLTFAINWFFGRDTTRGYHITNIAIHCLTAIMLYCTCIFLLRAPAIKKQYQHPAIIALLAASFWAVAPIHTQAVTYIVQRMAQLAALFSITAIFFYVRARGSGSRAGRIVFLACCAGSAILALGSKENSVLLPCSLVLVEYIFFFQGKSIGDALKKNKLKSFLAGTFFLAGIIFLLHRYGNLIFQYDHRTFTLQERLLTEPRILLFYLSEIFFPLPSKLSIQHDVILSTSLLSPWTTIPALAACLILIIAGLQRAKKYPLASFAILFFFLNHLVESTVLPLELIFEHRNYLPSLFLFLPVAAYLVSAVNTGRAKNRWPKKISTLAGIAVFLTISGYFTHTRNMAWATEISLWQDAVKKAPRSGRAMINLASGYADAGQYERAMTICDKAMDMEGSTRNKIRPIALQVKGSIYFNQGKFAQAESYYRKALHLRNDYTEAANNLITVLVVEHRYHQAVEEIDRLYRRTGMARMLLIRAALLLRLNKPEESLALYQKARHQLPGSTLITTGQGKALSILGHFTRADRLYKWAARFNEPDAILLRIENHLLAGNKELANTIMKSFLSSIPFNALLTTIETNGNDPLQIPLHKKLLRQAAIKAAEEFTGIESRSHENNR